MLIVCSYFLIQDFAEYKESKTANDELMKNVITNEVNQDGIHIDWEELKSINEDIIGWIKINNTNIDYPILKDNDNLKYMYHSFNKKHNSNGAIFTLDSNPFNNNITTIYGHNMKSGLMFTDLGKYLNKEFFYNHLEFEVYTKDATYKATVFSAYSTGVRTEEKNLENLSFTEEINYYKSKSVYPVENIGTIDKIVKLSTCSYINNKTTPTDQRYYIIAKLEKFFK